MTDSLVYAHSRGYKRPTWRQEMVRGAFRRGRLDALVERPPDETDSRLGPELEAAYKAGRESVSREA